MTYRAIISAEAPTSRSTTTPVLIHGYGSTPETAVQDAMTMLGRHTARQVEKARVLPEVMR